MSVQDRRLRDRQQRERLIVTAARDLAEAEGWSAVTTRRLAEAIEYSQPVLYSHFANKDAVVRAVALDGFAELARALRDARGAARSPRTALLALAHAYLEFASARPALYDAMFTLADLPFAQPDTPAVLNEGFAELRHALRPFVPAQSVDTHAELVWSALHGLATLSRSGRLRPDHAEQRLRLLLRMTTTGRPRSSRNPAQNE
jgi:AcrR family transcriptional regulator